MKTFLKIYKKDEIADMYNGGIIFRGTIELTDGGFDKKNEHPSSYEGMHVIEVDK